MAVAFDAVQANKTFSGVTSKTWNHTVGGSGYYVRISVGWEYVHGLDANNTASCTYAGANAPSVGVSARHGTGDGATYYADAQIFEQINPATGSQAIVISFTGGDAVNYGCACSVSYSGVDQTTASGTAVTSNGSGTSITDNVTSNSGDMISDAIFSYGNTTATTNTAAFTSRSDSYGFTSGSKHYYFGSAQDTTNSGTVAMAWTLPATAAWAHVAAQIIAAAGGASVVPQIKLLHDQMAA